jgi:hypothetical protein
MSSLLTAYEKHENMIIGYYGENTMLIDWEKDIPPSDLGDIRLVVKVSYDKDPSATIASTSDKSLLTIKNLADDTQMNTHNSTTSGFVNTYVKTINVIRKGLFMNYSAVSYDMGSYNDGIYNTEPFGATSIVVFSNNHPNMRNERWKKFSTHGYHGGMFGISRFANQQKLIIQFAGNTYSGEGEYIDFNFTDTTTEINYLIFASVKETSTNVFLLNFELWSFTDNQTDPVLVQSVSFTKVFDILTSTALTKDHYHSGIDRYTDTSDAVKSSILVFETRFYIGCIEGALKDVVITELLDYWRCVGIGFEYTITYQFIQSLDDLVLLYGGPEEYHQNRMIKLQPSQVLRKTFADNSVLTSGYNLYLLTIRVKVYSQNNKWRVNGHGSWSFEYHNGELKFSDGTVEVLSSISLSTQFNDFTCVVNPDYIYFYVNGVLHQSKINTVPSPLASWSDFDINQNANSLNIYDFVQVKLGVNDIPTQIYDEYSANKTNFFLHQSLTASHVLNVDTNFYTTLTPAYIAEPSSYLSSTSQTQFITPNTTNDSGNSMITIPDTQNRTFNLTYNFADNTTHVASVVSTLFDSTEPNESNELYPPNLSSFEYLLENKYRVMFHLNTITQGFAVPVEEVDFSYIPDARLSNGTFTTTINPMTTVGKENNQTITINNYSGSFIPLGYYDFDISGRNVETLNAPNTLIKHIHQSFVGTNIVDTNVKTISRYRQPYLKLISRQEFTRREQNTRYLYFVKQDYSSPISSITINYHVKTTNFTLGDFFPKNSTTSTTSAPVKAGYNINQQITFTYFISQNNLQEIFTVITNQTTQMIYEDDFYIEIVNINGSILPYSPSLYFQPFTYIPTIRFNYTATQVNFEMRLDITVNKNEDNITGFRIKLRHRNGAVINYNNFGVGGFTMTTPSSSYTIFTFTGSHFSNQNETLIQLIVASATPYEKVYDNETKIEFETFTLASTPVIINNPIINPTFTFSTLSTITYEEYTFTTIDNYTERVSMNLYLNTNRDYKTALDFWISFEYENNAVVAGTVEYGIDTDLWNYTIVPQSRTIGTYYEGFNFTATKIPEIPSNKHRLLTLTYTRYRDKQFSSIFYLLSVINTISPITNLLPFVDPTINESLIRFRDSELIVRPIQTVSPNTINVNIDLFRHESSQTEELVAEIWYNTKLTYSNATTAYPLTYTSIIATPITGSYEGFTQGQRITISSPSSYETGTILNILQIQLSPVNDYDEIDNNDFAVKLISVNSSALLIIEDTIIPLFNYQADVNITGSISEITEGEAYNFTVTLNQTNEHKFYVYYDILFNGDVLETNAPSSITGFVAGVSWSEKRIISNYFYEPNQSTATHNEVFRLKYFREGLNDDDFRIVIRTIRLQQNPIPTLTFNPTTSINSFTYNPEFQLRLYSSAVDDDITITVVLEKDNRPVRNFNFNFFVDNDRTINITEPRGGLLDEGTYTLTDQLGVDFSAIGYYSNTNKTIVQYTTAVDGVGLNQPSLEVFYFTIKRRQANYLIDKNDYATEFTFYEAFHTSSQYFNRQNDADKDDTPYIKPQLYLTNVSVSTLSANNHRLTYTINHPDLGINTTIKFRIFYRNMYIVLNGSPTKTDLSGYNPYETEIGFINGSQFSTIASAGYTTTRYQDFQTDTALADYITHDDFLIVLLDTSSTSQGDYEIPQQKYIPSTYLEPSTYNLRTASNRDVFEVSALNEKNYTTYNGNTIVNMRAGVKTFTDNIQITPTNVLISNTWYNLITPSTTPMFQFPITYDYATNGLDVMMTSIFKLNSMNDGQGAILVMGHENFFQLEIEKSSSPSVDAWGYLKIMGQFYTPGSPRIPITFGEHNAVKIRIVETSTNNFAIDMRHWIVSPSLVEQTPLSFTTTRIVVNPTSTNAIIHKKLGDAPTYVYTVGLTFTYDIEIQQASYRIGRFTIGEWNDTYFITQFDSYEGNYTNYASLDIRKQQAEWEYDWDTLQDYAGFGYLYTTIGQSRALALTQDYLFKKNFSTGSTLWGNTMRIGLIIVFRTTIPVEQLCLFLHGEEKSPPNHQLIVNRNGFDDAISIELNENNGSTLQQQHLNKIDWEKPQYEYLYYAKFFKRATPAGSAYEAYDIETKLIGLNNSTNQTFTSVALPQFLKTSSSKSTDFTDNLYIGKTILPNTYGGFAVGYMNYFEYKSDAHSAYEIERVRRDWETIY